MVISYDYIYKSPTLKNVILQTTSIWCVSF